MEEIGVQYLQLGINTVTEVTIWATEAKPLYDAEGKPNSKWFLESDPYKDTENDPELTMLFAFKPYSANARVGAREL